MKSIALLLLLSSALLGAEEKIGVQFIGDEADASSALEIRLFDAAAQTAHVHYRWIQDDDTDVSDCTYMVNYFADYNVESQHLSMTMTFFAGEARDSFECSLSIKTDTPEDLGVKMAGALLRIGLMNVGLPQDLAK